MDLLSLHRVGDGRLICLRVRRADGFLARLRGLIGRSSIGEDEGLYLPASNSIHMLAMRFPIDCLFLSQPAGDGTRRVVATRSGLRPWTGVVWYVRGAEGVVEMAAGALARSGVRPGDSVRLEASDSTIP